MVLKDKFEELIKITRNVDDIHCMDTGFKRAVENLNKADISQNNKENLKKFVTGCRHEGLKKSTITFHINYGKRMIEDLKRIGVEKDLHEIDQYDFDQLLIYLEDEKKLKKVPLEIIKNLLRSFLDGIPMERSPSGLKISSLKISMLQCNRMSC